MNRINQLFQVDVMPDEAVDFFIQSTDEAINRSECISLLEKEYKNRRKYYAEYYGEDWEVSYEIENITNLSKNKTKQEIEDYYDISLDSEDINLEDSGVTEVKEAEISTTIEGEKGSETDSVSLLLLKIDGSWYVAAINIY